ncbi:MAG: ABC transporter ATP-binding protein [Anaerovoracaceae bacterium]
MIEVKNLTKVIEDRVILDDLNMKIDKGSIYGLVGKNGAGKTTIIKHLVGLYQPTSGNALVGGEDVFDNPVPKSKIGYIPDDLFFYPLYSIKDMARFLRGVYKNWDEARYLEMLEDFGLDSRKRISSFSKGMKKQAAFILTLSQRPEYIFLDEPIDGLDPLIRKKVFKYLIEDVAERNCSILVSSHNLRELEDICDEIGIIEEGTMLLQQNTEELKREFCKIQVAFDDKTDKPYEKLEIIHSESMGNIDLLILKNSDGRAEEILQKHNPLVFNILPLTLEEIFIYKRLCKLKMKNEGQSPG